MSADTAPGWAEVREVHELGTADEWRRYASAETTVPGVLHAETREPRPAAVRLEHAYSPGAADPDPRERPLIVLTVDTDFMCEAYLSADVADRCPRLGHLSAVLGDGPPARCRADRSGRQARGRPLSVA